MRPEKTICLDEFNFTEVDFVTNTDYKKVLRQFSQEWWNFFQNNSHENLNRHLSRGGEGLIQKKDGNCVV